MGGTVEVAALVTGASRGIGAATARSLARAGHLVFLNFRSRSSEAEAVLGGIVREGGRAELLQFDVRDGDACETALQSVTSRGIFLGIVVNNAGVVADAPFPILSRTAWRDVLDTTLDGFFNVTRPLVMPMVRKRWGRIINVASVSGVLGNRGQVNYAAAKAGLIGATRALAQEVAKRGVTVNAVAPGIIDTEMTAALPKEFLEHVPMRRPGTPDEVADLIAFLAGEKAAYMTGQVICVGGGLG